jgi:hypothetical protein
MEDQRETQGRSQRKVESAEQLNAIIIFILMGLLVFGTLLS